MMVNKESLLKVAFDYEGGYYGQSFDIGKLTNQEWATLLHVFSMFMDFIVQKYSEKVEIKRTFTEDLVFIDLVDDIIKSTHRVRNDK